jgi:hypothetical protein
MEYEVRLMEYEVDGTGWKLVGSGTTGNKIYGTRMSELIDCFNFHPRDSCMKTARETHKYRSHNPWQTDVDVDPHSDIFYEASCDLGR